MKDTQHYSTSAVFSAPGFEILQNEENGAYYFCCNDLNGKAILQSKDYPALKVAESSLQAALRFAKQTKNYARKKQGEQHFFIIKSNNQQEVAKSILFKNEKAAQNAMEYVLQIAVSSKSLTEKLPVEEENEADKGLKPPLRETTKAKAQPKYSFKIDLYQPDDNQPLSGKIEYLLTQESATFQGLNEQAIARFMQRHLPKEAQQATDREGFPAQQAILEALSAAEGKPVSSVAAGSPLVFARLKMKHPKNQEKEWNLSISARLVGSNRVILRTESKARLQTDDSVSLTLPGSYFTEGVYRLEVSAHTAGQRQEAGCIFQVY